MRRQNSGRDRKILVPWKTKTEPGATTQSARSGSEWLCHSNHSLPRRAGYASFDKTSSGVGKRPVCCLL